MSVKAISHVWEHSKQSGTKLLLLLALADHADDKGVCWPGIDRLARKTRQSRRNVTRLLAELQKSGEIRIGVNEGPHGTNLYYLPKMSFPKTTGDPRCPKGEDKQVPQMSYKPSLTVIELPGSDGIRRQLKELGYSSQNAATLAPKCIENELGIEDIYAWWDYIEDYNTKKAGRGKIRSPLGFLRSKIEMGERLPARSPVAEDVTKRAEARQQDGQLLSEWQALLKKLADKLFVPQVYPRLLELRLVGKENGTFLIAHNRQQVDYLTTRLPKVWKELKGKCRVVV